MLIEFDEVKQKRETPIYRYPGGDSVSTEDLPEDTEFKWIDSLGGGKLDGPIPFGTVRPDGKQSHGGVYTKIKGKSRVEYHYASDHSTKIKITRKRF